MNLFRLPNNGSLTRRQAIAVLAGLACLIPAAAAWLLFPKYLVDGKWEHHSVFDPPSIRVGNGYSQLTAEDIKRLSQDPRQAQILANLRAMPRQVPLRPFWIGSKYGDGRNVLFGIFLLTLVGFFLALKAVGIL